MKSTSTFYLGDDVHATLQEIAEASEGVIVDDHTISVSSALELETLQKRILAARRNPERQFDGMIFLGNGDHSISDVDLLKRRLDFGINLLGGSQQGPYAGEYDLEIQNVVRDLVAAFGYDPSDLTFRKLPYPGKIKRLYYDPPKSRRTE